MKELTCCVSGHRSLPMEQIDDVKRALEQEIDRAVRDGFVCFISSFADGADLLFAEIVMRKLREKPYLKLVAALPYRKRLDTLRKSERTKELIDCCTEIYVAAEEYHPSVYAKRNRCMVERSDRVIVVYDGREKGGTVGTIRLAHRMKKELREIPVGELHIPEHMSTWR